MSCPGVLFVLESFRRHMDNGRWLCQRGFESAGYRSAGYGCPPPEIGTTDVERIVKATDPEVVLFWPRYEWDHEEWLTSEVIPEHKFQNWEYLLTRPDILRVTVLHDAATNRKEQHQWHKDFQPHVYLCWYHQTAVRMFNPHVLPEQYLRTYHVLDGEFISLNRPYLRENRKPCVIAGARNDDVYPLRGKVHEWIAEGVIPSETIKHPGYAQLGSTSNSFLSLLSQYRVAICTCSVYGFALRKIFEATAAGCKVITDLPAQDQLPGIEGNLTRVSADIYPHELRELIDHLASDYNPNIQAMYATRAWGLYDYRAECNRVAQDLQNRSYQLRESL